MAGRREEAPASEAAPRGRPSAPLARALNVLAVIPLRGSGGYIDSSASDPGPEIPRIKQQASFQLSFSVKLEKHVNLVVSAECRISVQIPIHFLVF